MSLELTNFYPRFAERLCADPETDSALQLVDRTGRSCPAATSYHLASHFLPFKSVALKSSVNSYNSPNKLGFNMFQVEIPFSCPHLPKKKSDCLMEGWVEHLDRFGSAARWGGTILISQAILTAAMANHLKPGSSGMTKKEKSLLTSCVLHFF